MRTFPSLPFRPQFLGLITVVAVLLSAPPVRGAQGDDEPLSSDGFDDTITVTGSRLELPLGESGRFVEVLGREEMAAHGVRSVPELLQLFPGLDVRRRGAYGVQADLSIRGSSFEQVLVLVDGVPVNNPQTGHHTLDLPVPIDAIERVEVLYGPGSALYGAGAAGGVVHIVTRRAGSSVDAGEASTVEPSGGRSLHGSAELFAGENSLGGGSASVSWAPKSSRSGEGGGGHLLAVERAESAGYRPGTEFDQGAAFYRGSIGAVEVTAGASDRDFGAFSFYSTRFPDELESTQARFATAAWRGRAGGTSISVQGAARWHDDLFVLDRRDPGLLTNHHEDRSLDLQVVAVRRTPIGRLEAGTGWVAEDLDSSNLGVRDRERWGSFAALAGERGRWSWRGGLHADRLEGDDSDGDWEVHPTVAVTYAVGRDRSGRVRASAGSAYRLPSFTELYYLDPVTSGAADLDPERTWTYELGYDRVLGASRLGASLFERRGRNLIDFVRAPGDDLFRAVNLRRVTTRGVELVAARRLGTGRAGAGATLTGSYVYLDSTGDEPAGASRYVFDYLEHRALVRLEAPGPWGLSWAGAVSYNQRHEGDSWTRVDARLAKRLTGFGGAGRRAPVEVFVQVENLTDERYVEVGAVEEPGRWAVVGVRLGAR